MVPLDSSISYHTKDLCLCVTEGFILFHFYGCRVSVEQRVNIMADCLITATYMILTG